MTYPQKALKQQLRICEAAAITPEEKAGCEFWRRIFDRAEAEYRDEQNNQAVNFAQSAQPQEIEK